ncbi:MAG: glycosyltransferase [Flavobacterium sp.]|nr:MAG: glycosyltransferase [Flavobacterium sp.]
MRILCFIDSLGSGGAQRQLVNLGIGFKERGHDVSFLTYHHEDFYVNVIINNAIKYTCIEEANLVKRLLKIRKFIRSGNYDVVISFLEAAVFMSEIAGFPFKNWKLIVGERSANPNIFKSVKLRLYRWCHFFADHVVANSHENIDIIAKINPLLPKSKYKVIYNMIDANIWAPSVRYIPNNGKLTNIVIVASHQYLKNLKGVIEGVNMLSIENKNKIHISWYGRKCVDGSYEEAQVLVDKYRLKPIFSFYDATSDILEKMQNADAVGLFSFYEGLPNVICEAMAVGKPVVVTPVSDLPILIKENGIICKSSNPDAIASALNSFLELNLDQRKEMGLALRRYAIELFSKEHILDKYEELMKSN